MRLVAGTTIMRTSLWTFLPLSIFAATLRSSMRPFVQEPRYAWSIWTLTSLAGATLLGRNGFATIGTISLASYSRISQ